MRFDVLAADRLERAVAHVQRHRGAGDPSGVECFEEPGCEVETGCRGRYGPPGPCIDRLVAVAIGRLVGPFDVRGQRHVSDRFDRVVDAPADARRQADRATAVEMTGEDFEFQPVAGSLKHRASPLLEFLARVDQHVPPLVVCS